MSDQTEAAPAAGAVRAAIEFDRLPWIRPLLTAYIRNFASVAGLFVGDPRDWSARQDAIARATRSVPDRRALADVVATQLTERRAPAAALASARRLAAPASVAVLTGQQAGLFGGPLDTLLKAISTVQIARTVGREHGVDVVPVFWVESEDHDWAEVRSTDVLDADGRLVTIALGDLEGAGEQSIASLRIGEGIDAALTSLAAALSPTEFTADLLGQLRDCYQPGAGVSFAFARWLDRLLGPEGLVVFDAGDPRAKPLAASLFAREIQEGGLVSRLAREAGHQLRRLGHAPQVEPADDATGLFYLTDCRRQAVRRGDGGFLIGTARHEAAALAAEAMAHPERFSPNVLLRPLVQDWMFPTIGYVTGPSELAYQAQLLEAYRAFGVEPPLFPRASATLLDAPAARFLDRSGMPFEHLQPQDESALNAFLHQQLPPALDRALAALDTQLSEGLDGMRGHALAIDPTLAGAFDTTATRVRETLKSLQGKIVQAAKRKDETLRRQFQRTRGLLFPGGSPQERVLGVPFFLNRYGPALISRLVETLPEDTSKHWVVQL